MSRPLLKLSEAASRILPCMSDGRLMKLIVNPLNVLASRPDCIAHPDVRHLPALDYAYTVAARLAPPATWPATSFRPRRAGTGPLRLLGIIVVVQFERQHQQRWHRQAVVVLLGRGRSLVAGDLGDVIQGDTLPFLP
jgi:hypothetical protein